MGVLEGPANKLTHTFHTQSRFIIQKDAIARITTIATHNQLGSGLNIALEDLEIRGAGDLLGSNQSGNVKTVGIELYSQLLNQATKLKNLDTEITNVEVDLDIATLIPESFIKNPIDRIEFYRLIANANNRKEIKAIQHRMEDQYGLIPTETHQLLQQQSLIIKMRSKRLLKLIKREQQCKIVPHTSIKCDWSTVKNNLTKLNTSARITPNGIMIALANTQSSDLKLFDELLTVMDSF